MIFKKENVKQSTWRIEKETEDKEQTFNLSNNYQVHISPFL